MRPLAGISACYFRQPHIVDEDSDRWCRSSSAQAMTWAPGRRNGRRCQGTGSVASVGVGSVRHCRYRCRHCHFRGRRCRVVALSERRTLERQRRLQLAVGHGDGLAAIPLSKKLAAEELLCDRPEVYAAFKRAALPCHSRTDSQLRRDYQALASAPPSTASAPQTALQQNDFRTARPTA